MKKHSFLVFLYIVFFSLGINAQIGWIQKANFPGVARYYDAGFSIGHYGFIGCGANGSFYYNDFYKWNQATNTWSAITAYPGAGYHYSPIAFTIEGKGYVGLGWTGSNGSTDLWRYDTTANTWTQMASLPGRGRYDANCFVIGHKAYLISGSAGGPPYIGDAWVYDAHSNTWTQLNNPASGKVDGAAVFTIGNHGYYVGGWDGGTTHSAGFEYDTTTDTWTPIASIPNYGPGVSGNSKTWVLGSKGYVFNGFNVFLHTFTQGWVYDTITKNWCEFTNMGKLQRTYAAALVVNGKLYMGTGFDSLQHYLNDYWQYNPVTQFTLSDTTVCGNDSVHFRGFSTFDSTGSVIWNWSFPGGSPAISHLQNPDVYYSTSGTYNVKLIVTACGGDDTVSRNIKVIAEGLGGVTVNGRTAICLGATDTLTVSGGTHYFWSNGATTSSIIISPVATITYSVTVTNGNCQKDTAITITVHPDISISVSGTDTVCAGSSATLTASGGTSYLWNTGATTSSISPSPVSNTTYTVQVSNGFCSKDTTVSVDVKDAPNLNVNSSGNAICSGDSITMNASGADRYLWSPSIGLSCTSCPNPTAKPATSTTYTVTGYGNNGCTSAKSISLIVEIAPVLAAIPNQSICSGNSVTLVATVTSGSGGTYLWQPGGSTGASITVSPNTTTTYTVQCTNACGITTTDVTILVTPGPLPDFTADITQGCAPFCIQFRDLSTVSAGKISAWNWSFGNGDTSNLENPVYCYPAPGNYSPMLTVIADGCSATLKNLQMITVFSNPVAQFVYTPQQTTILEPTIQFTDKSTDAYGIAYWFWTFGDDVGTIQESSLQNPKHTYQDTGTYCPKLVVMNNKGCVDTAVNCLVIEPLFTLYIPSAFSPNADGANDIFEPKGEYIRSFEMYIFDRWGMELYHTTDITKGWNGTVSKDGMHAVSATICQEDSYVYTITATDCSNKKHSYVGEVTLIK